MDKFLTDFPKILDDNYYQKEIFKLKLVEYLEDNSDCLNFY